MSTRARVFIGSTQSVGAECLPGGVSSSVGVYFVDVKNLFRTVLKMYFGDAADLRAEVLILKKKRQGYEFVLLRARW